MCYGVLIVATKITVWFSQPHVLLDEQTRVLTCKLTGTEFPQLMPTDFNATNPHDRNMYIEQPVNLRLLKMAKSAI